MKLAHFVVSNKMGTMNGNGNICKLEVGTLEMGTLEMEKGDVRNGNIGNWR